MLDDNGFIRDWLITKAWICPADDLEKLLKDSGDPFGKDGRWVLTNGPDIAPLKGKIFKNQPFTAQQTVPTGVITSLPNSAHQLHAAEQQPATEQRGNRRRELSKAQRSQCRLWQR